jgi:hypothetical protein
MYSSHSRKVKLPRHWQSLTGWRKSSCFWQLSVAAGVVVIELLLKIGARDTSTGTCLVAGRDVVVKDVEVGRYLQLPKKTRGTMDRR